MYSNLISPTEFNQISTVGFNMISPVDPTKNGLQNLHVFQPDFTVGFNLISKLRACWDSTTKSEGVLE